MVAQGLQAGEDCQENHPDRGRVFHAQCRPEGTEKEVIGTDVDRAQHRDQPQQVEPRGQPASEAVTENRAPVVQAASGGVGRGNLRHGHGEYPGDQATDWPADPDGCPARARGALGQGVDATREDADDRKGNGEVGENPHSS
ncbi:hypothetical protein D9M73_195500 [compost metagenome]